MCYLCGMATAARSPSVRVNQITGGVIGAAMKVIPFWALDFSKAPTRPASHTNSETEALK